MDLQVKSDPESDQYGASQLEGESPTAIGHREGQQSKKSAVRKRTKTGCLSTSNHSTPPIGLRADLT